MLTITKWNNWRNANISDTNIVKDAKDGVYFFSANAFGLKGKLPGGKHSWAAIRENSRWITLEITDLETIRIQRAEPIQKPFVSCEHTRQPIVSNRSPGTRWFGNPPSVIYYYGDIAKFKANLAQFPYRYQAIALHKNNCNTYLSYLLWAAGIKKKFWYIGFKNHKHWDTLYNV